MSEAEFKARLEDFEGPMDLLMHLVDVNKIDLYNFKIAPLTEQYMDFLDSMRQFDIEIASEFLMMGAQLLLMKSRRLLPRPAKAGEEAEAEDDEKKFAMRLIEYRRFKEISVKIAEMLDNGARYFQREPLSLPVRRMPPETIPIGKLWAAYKLVIAMRSETVIPKVIVAHEEYRVKEQMERIIKNLGGKNPVPLSAIASSGTRGEIVSLFLALLELIRRKMALARQGGLFEPIMVSIGQNDSPLTGDIDDENVFL